MDTTITSPLARRISGMFSFRNFNLLLLTLTGCAVLLLAVQTVHFLPVINENIYPESSGVLSALRWSQGQPLYTDFRKAPYLTTPFPPLWYVLTAQGTRFGFHDLDSLTRVGRILTLMCLLGITLLAYLRNRRLGCPRLLSILAPAFFLAVPVLVPWAVTARPDLLALMLSFLAVYVATRGGNFWLGAAGAVAALAFLARHNSVTAPVAIVLWLVFLRRWKHAFIFCAVWWGIVAPVLATVQIASGGNL